MLNIIIAIIVLSIIIIVHEFGHFILAKANGVTVLEFSLGFGPKLVHFKKGETEYCIKLIPFGGACMMLGEDFLDTQDNSDVEDEVTKGNVSDNKNAMTDKALEKAYDMDKSFARKSVWARMSIILAGPIFNFILAFVLAVIVIGYIGYDPCNVDKVYEGSPAAMSGLQEGDRIIEVNGRDMTFSRELSIYMSLYPEKTLNITYERNGETYTTTVTPQYSKSAAYQIGVRITPECVIQSVVKNTPAQEAGIKKNDIIRSVDGQKISNGSELSQIIATTKDKEVEVGIERDGSEMTLKMSPKLTESESYYVGLASYGERVKTTPIKTLGYSFKEVGYWISTVFDSLKMMFTGKVTLDDIAGPVGVINVMGQVVEESKSSGISNVLLSLLNIAVMISANLGVMNLLPIPALDGGRFVFLVIEALRGKPVSKEREGMVHFVGMVLLMLLMVFVMFNDIRNIFM